MRLFLATLTVFFSLNAFADSAVTLKRLSCAASNGVTIESVGRRDGLLVVEATLGLLTKKFNAALAIDSEAKSTTIDLVDETGRVSHLIDLTIDLKTRRKQTRLGSIVRTGDGLVAPHIVATALCELTVR